MNMRHWFTSDTHFWHRGILRHRPEFESIEQMNERLIERWNARIRPGDTVYHLGDLSFAGVERTVGILERLHGRKVWIVGNHDKGLRNKPAIREHFESAHDLLEIKVPTTDGSQRITLCHFPLITWNMAHRGAWHLHGHSHGNLKPHPGLRIDVGVDCWKFEPVSFEQLQVAMAGLRPAVVDHHVPHEECEEAV